MVGLKRTGLVAVALIAAISGALAAQPAHHLTTSGTSFIYDGKPLQILSGEMHYSRVPRAYWQDRMRKARAMGLNTISTYVFWNYHESSPGKYDFSGEKDVAEYIRTAQREGLHVILRPGPYVCAEWELGGYPAWLLADTSLVLRSTDSNYTRAAERWLNRLGKELSPLLAEHGGPIIAIQVENEYGSFDKDKAYMAWQRDALKRAGFADAFLYTADGDVQLPNGTLTDLPAVVNFGQGGADSAFARLARFRPDQPLMTGEYWAGWFDQWAKPHAQLNTARQTRELTWMLDHGYSINLYMFHGGVTPGFMNGANGGGRQYLPQTSSYDYASALDESGRPTEKYTAFRDMIAAHRPGETLPAIPETPAPISIASFELTEVAPLWNNLRRAVQVDKPRSMESFGQSYGYILYRTTVAQPAKGDLIISDVRDYAQVYLNGVLAGTLDRRLNQDRIPIDITAPNTRVDILVENTGRINFTKALRTERKGITKSVMLGDRELTGWDVWTLPMESPQDNGFGKFPSAAVAGPSFYRGSFNVARTGDTFLDLRGWGKGTVWVNGHQLGRFWDVGPQQTLYVPGPWLKSGRNEVIVFDLVEPPSRTLSGLASPILSEVHADPRTGAPIKPPE